MTLVTPSLVFSKVSTESTSTHIQQTLLLTSSTLSVTRVHLLMMLVSSTAHMYLSRWYVPLVSKPSNQKSDSRLVMESLRIHLQRVLPLLRLETTSQPTQTFTTEELRLQILCDINHITLKGDLRVPFFYLNKNKNNDKGNCIICTCKSNSK